MKFQAKMSTSKLPYAYAYFLEEQKRFIQERRIFDLEFEKGLHVRNITVTLKSILQLFLTRGLISDFCGDSDFTLLIDRNYIMCTFKDAH